MKKSVQEMEKQEEKVEKSREKQHLSAMEPINIEAYGGGIYGKDTVPEKPRDPPASQTQSADGEAAEVAVAPPPAHKPPPSTGDRDLDITGQSYIQ